MYKTIFHIPVHENIKGHTIWLIVHEQFNSRYFFTVFTRTNYFSFIIDVNIYNIWLCILFHVFGGMQLQLNQVHC